MIELRSVRETDLRSIFDLDQVCFPPGIAYSLQDFRSLLRSPAMQGVLAEEDSALAGFAMALIELDRGSSRGRIITIDVAPAFRRKGVGQMLMKRLEALLQNKGALSIRLEVAVNNDGALELYDKLGFTEVGRLRGYYSDGLDALAMEKRLGASN